MKCPRCNSKKVRDMTSEERTTETDYLGWNKRCGVCSICWKEEMPEIARITFSAGTTTGHYGLAWIPGTPSKP